MYSIYVHAYCRYKDLICFELFLLDFFNAMIKKQHLYNISILKKQQEQLSFHFS